MNIIDSISTKQIYPDDDDPKQEYFISVAIQFNQIGEKLKKIKVIDISLTTGPDTNQGERTLHPSDVSYPQTYLLGTRISVSFRTDFDYLTLVEGAKFTAELKESSEEEYHNEVFELQNVNPISGTGQWVRK